MPIEVQSELCRQNLVPSFPHSRRSIVAEHPLILLEQLLMNEKVCAFILLLLDTKAIYATALLAGFIMRPGIGWDSILWFSKLLTECSGPSSTLYYLGDFKNPVFIYLLIGFRLFVFLLSIGF